jgi:hypothetical protein
MLVQDTWAPGLEGSNPFINTGNVVTIFLKGSEKSVVNLDGIYSFVREEFDDYAAVAV